MKQLFITSLLLLSIGLSNCSEDDVLSSDLSNINLSSSSTEVLDPKRPILNSVTASGSKVTLKFTNYSSPKKPEGGFELMVNGKRTGTSLTPWLDSDDKNLSMVFNVEDAGKNTYQVYARWNSGYLSSNELKAGEIAGGETPSSPPPSDDTPSSSPAPTPDDVKKPSNLKQPVISNVAISGSNVTVTFVNFAAPKNPEGGFELMLNGKRTGTSITPWVTSSNKTMTMKFSLNDAKKQYYQIYARWNSGYLSSEEFYPGESSPGNESPAPEEPEEDDTPGNSPNDVNLSFLSSMKLLKGYEFEDNIGRNVDEARDGLKVHHLGHDKGRVKSVDGVGAYHFKVTPGNYTRHDRNWKVQLVPRNLPSPYFKNGWEPTWGREYVYQMRVKLSQNYDIGREYVALISTKNDYKFSREGSFLLLTEGDHYYVKQNYATKPNTKRGNEAEAPEWYATDGKKLQKGTDFNPTSRVGNGYSSLKNDIGKWITWTVHIKWSYQDDGFVKLYKDDKLFHEYNGPNSHNDSQAPYIKFGLSNAFWGEGERTGSTSQEMYMDYFRVYAK